MSVVSGLHEFVFSAHVSERERLLRFWAGLGFQPDAEGALSAADAEALLADGFKDIKTEVLRDPYAVTDHRDLLYYLCSFPPASDASEDQLAQLEKLIIEKMNASGDVFHLRTEAALITARA